jgi:VWA domain containing CoxE-like protein
MRRRAKLVLVATLLWLVAPAAVFGNAQQDACRQRSIQLRVIDRMSQIVTDLDPSHFAASCHGKPVRIVSITPNRAPRRVFVLLDASGSMEPVHKFTFDVAEELLNDLPAGTQVAAVAFATKAAGNWTFSTDRDALREQLEALRNERHLEKELKGYTALLSTMEQSLSAFGEPQDGDSLYVISDGEDNASTVSWQKFDAMAIQHRIRVFAMRVEWFGGRGPTPEGLENHLQDIVASTGGASVVARVDRGKCWQQSCNEPLRDSTGKPTRRESELDLQARVMMSGSKMQIELPERAGKKRDWDLRFSDPKGGEGPYSDLPARFAFVFDICHGLRRPQGYVQTSNQTQNYRRGAEGAEKTMCFPNVGAGVKM